MAVTRRIIQLAGSRAEFALADDGSIWLWTQDGWKDAQRGPLPALPDYNNMVPIAPWWREAVRAALDSALDKMSQEGINTQTTRKDSLHAPSTKPEIEGPRRTEPGTGQAPQPRIQDQPDGPGVQRSQEGTAPRKRGRPPRYPRSPS